MSDFAVASSAGKQETRDRNEKQKVKKVEKVQKFEKMGVPRKWKVENYRFPLWLVNFGPCSFWFRAHS